MCIYIYYVSEYLLMNIVPAGSLRQICYIIPPKTYSKYSGCDIGSLRMFLSLFGGAPVKGSGLRASNASVP